MSFLQHSGVCEAAETSARGVSATAYAGAGRLREPNNESYEDEYDVERFGLGGLGVMRFGSLPSASAPGSERGWFGVLGGGLELEASRRTLCGYSCPRFGSVDASAREPLYWGKHFAARVGAGYSWSIFEFRAGALAALPDPKVTYAEPLLFPDVALRVGRRSLGWFELGLGAYDASSTFRPGLYLGGALGKLEQVRVSGHFGVHLPNGFCCSTVPLVGLRSELGLDHAFGDSFSGGAGVALTNDLSGFFVAEGNARVTVWL